MPPNDFSGLVPTQQQLDQLTTQVPGVSEWISWTLYHYVAYPAAGAQQFAFFGVAAGGAPNGDIDTNMEQAGVLPQPQEFLVQGIEAYFEPGPSPYVGKQAEENPLYGADKHLIRYTPSKLTLTIGTKPYVKDGPLVVFPFNRYMTGPAALSDATTAAASQQTIIDDVEVRGKPFMCGPPLYIKSQMNFGAIIQFPAAVPLPSTLAGRIGVRLCGMLKRAAQ